MNAPKAVRLGLLSLLPLAIIATGCSSSGGSSDASSASVTLAKASDINANTLNDAVGLLQNGTKYGLKESSSNFNAYTSGSIALQVLLSGKAQIASVAPSDAITAMSEGVPIKMFCPETAGYDMRIVGTGDVTSLDYLMQHSDTVPVAVESAGGPTNMLFNLALAGRGFQDKTVQDFKNTKILNDSGLRTSALVNGTVKVANINYYQLPLVQKAVGANNVHVLSVVMKDVPQGTLVQSVVATKSWLDKHQDLAAKACASVLEGNKKLSGSFDYYKQMADKYIVPNVDSDTLKTTWDSIVAANLFPYKPPFLDQKGLDSTAHILNAIGLTKKTLPYADMVDTAVLKKATDLFNGS